MSGPVQSRYHYEAIACNSLTANRRSRHLLSIGFSKTKADCSLASVAIAFGPSSFL